jgi:transposase InsO family protein
MTPGEKMEIITLVEQSQLSVKATLKELGINRSTFYQWYKRYLQCGYEGLSSQGSLKRGYWNQVPEKERNQVVEIALQRPELSCRELAWHIVDQEGWFISESTVYRILKSRGLITTPAYRLMEAADRYVNPTTAVNQLWQTDFTYFKIQGWGWYYLSTVLDDYSRFILSWQLCPSMQAIDAEASLQQALQVAGLSQEQRPRVLTDNGSAYVSKYLKQYFHSQNIRHVRSAPHHPMTQGKIERYHRSMKNLLLLEHYYLPQELEQGIAEWVQYYNHHRYHESLDNCTPAQVYYNKREEKLKQREKIKQRSLTQRRKSYIGQRLQNT